MGKTYTQYASGGVTASIGLTAEREDSEPHRLDRLHMVLGYVEAMGQMLGIDLLPAVLALHDHKGELSVTWRREPDRAERRAFDAAWEMYDGGLTRHLVSDI